MIDNENLTIAWTLSYTDDDRTVDLETTSNQMFLIWDWPDPNQVTYPRLNYWCSAVAF